MRNFTDAASQTQYRACARFLLSASVSNPATQTNNVVCHKWLSTGRFILSAYLSQSLLSFSKIRQRKGTGFNKVRHDRLGPAAEQSQEVIDQSSLRRVAGDHRLEKVGVADLLGCLTVSGAATGYHAVSLCWIQTVANGDFQSDQNRMSASGEVGTEPGTSFR
jgi:hypothetical protein